MDDPPQPQTLSALYQTHAPALILYARNWLNRTEADDIVQRVFLKILTQKSGVVTSGDHVPPLQNPRAYLFQCVRNESITQSRAHHRQRRREQSLSKDPLFLPTPEDAIDAAAAQSALATLPNHQREIVTLRIWSGLTLAEISQITAQPISTLHDQYRAALKTLRRHLEPTCQPTTQPQ